MEGRKWGGGGVAFLGRENSLCRGPESGRMGADLRIKRACASSKPRQPGLPAGSERTLGHGPFCTHACGGGGFQEGMEPGVMATVSPAQGRRLKSDQNDEAFD